jgi:hypothetical protein
MSVENRSFGGLPVPDVTGAYGPARYAKHDFAHFEHSLTRGLTATRGYTPFG